MNLDDLNRRLPNKRAFITGAGSGLGSEFAKLLAANNWILHLADLDLKSLEKVRSNLQETEIHIHQLNVADKLAFESISNQIKQSGQIDLVINNAGIGDGDFIEDYPLEEWERMIHTNLMGVFYGIHYLLPLFPTDGGMIINIGSAAGFMNAPGMSAYNVSKAGVYSLSETLYHELKPKNIHVSVATPTFFKTNIVSQAKGSGKFVSFAEKQMKYSKTNANEMANVILREASKGKFQILFPKDAKRSYLVKKWYPKLVSKQFVKLLARLR